MSSEQVYSTKQLADGLKLGSAMVRKYAVALEKLTGEDIPLKRRDGRQFSGEHYRIISAAKSLIDSNQGLSVDTALKMVLTPSQMPLESPTPVLPSGSEAITAEAITAAIREGNAELAEEVRRLREQLEARPALESAPPKNRKSAAGEHRLFVRFALWLEKKMGRP